MLLAFFPTAKKGFSSRTLRCANLLTNHHPTKPTRSIHSINLLSLHGHEISKPKSINLRGIDHPDATRYKLNAKEAKIEFLKKFWSGEPARVMRAIRERQHAQRNETEVKISQHKSADPLLHRYLVLSMRLQHQPEKTYLKEHRPGVKEPEKSFASEKVGCGGDCACAKATGIQPDGFVTRNAQDVAGGVSSASSEPTYDSAWKKVCKRGCLTPCKRHAAIFVTKEADVRVEVKERAVEDGKTDLGVDIQVGRGGIDV